MKSGMISIFDTSNAPLLLYLFRSPIVSFDTNGLEICSILSFFKALDNPLLISLNSRGPLYVSAV